MSTVTVTSPPELVAISVYVVVASAGGDTSLEPFTSTGSPFKVALSAFSVVQVIVEVSSPHTLVLLAIIVAVGSSTISSGTSLSI